MIPTKKGIQRAGSSPASRTNKNGRKFRTFCRFTMFYRTFQTKCSEEYGSYWKIYPQIVSIIAIKFAMKFATRLQLTRKVFQLIDSLGAISLCNFHIMLVHGGKIGPAANGSGDAFRQAFAV